MLGRAHMVRKVAFKLKIVTETDVIFYGDCERLFVPYEKSTIAILLHHTPMIMQLSEGDVTCYLHGKTTKVCHMKSGLLHVQEDDVTLVANGAQTK